MRNLLMTSLTPMLLASACSEPAADARQAEPPNIVLIIGDDHGYDYFGFNGNEDVVTPNLDLLAAQGSVFGLAHTTSNYCRPSLQTFITGLYPVQYEQRSLALQAEILANDADYQAASEQEQRWRSAAVNAGLMSEFDTLPRMLSSLGYASFQGGKWWEQSYATAGFTHGMTESWDWDAMAQPGWFFEFMGGDGLDLGRTTMDPVLDFISENQDQPLFIWYGPSLPHTPLDPPFQHRKYYETGEYSESASLYYGNITWFDHGVGTLLDALEAAGELENTLIVYVNDNGWEQGPHDEYTGDRDLFSNGGTRGKLSYFDNAFRTPIIFHWPGHIPNARNDEELISAIDIVPTILDYVGLEGPDDLPGISLRALMEHGQPTGREFLVGRMDQHRADSSFIGETVSGDTDLMGRNEEAYYARSYRWHYVWVESTGEEALFDLINDPDERNNVLAENMELVPQFRTAIEDWRATFVERN